MNVFQEFFQGISGIFGVVLDIWFLVFPFAFYYLFRILWLKFVRRKYQHSLKSTMLEIIPPKDVEKSPKLMESIFAGLAGVIKNPTIVEVYIQGFLPDYFSFEIVGTEGDVHFYIRTQKKYQNLIEAHFYAQYPNIEILEVPDYIERVPVTIPNKEWDLWGTEFEFTNKEQAIPIRTYRFFDETVTGKMIDPLAGVAEVMAKTGPGQHMWLQYLVAPRGKEGDWVKEFGKPAVQRLIGATEAEQVSLFKQLGIDILDIGKNIPTAMMALEPQFTDLKTEKKELQPLEFRLTPGQKEILKALESNIGKQQFQIKMRYLYLGRREVFDKSTGVSALIGAIKQFNDMNLNGVKPIDDTKTYANFLFVEPRLRFRQRLIYYRYRDRDWDAGDNTFYMSSEELATVFHIPDMVVATPTLPRVLAKQGGAPANLPVE